MDSTQQSPGSGVCKNNYDDGGNIDGGSIDGGNIDGGNIRGGDGEMISICLQAKYTERGIANLQKWIKLSGDLPGKIKCFLF